MVGTVLLFHTWADACKFVKINFEDDPNKKDWIRAVVELTDFDLNNIKSKFTVEEQVYARKMLNHPFLELGFEIVELSVAPELIYKGVKQGC